MDTLEFMDRIDKIYERDLKYESLLTESQEINFKVLNEHNGGGINYREYLNNEVGEIMDQNKIIYPASRIYILYDYPFLSEIKFYIKSEKEEGFTTRELIDKIVRYYYLLIQIEYDYNIDNGTMISNNGSRILHSPDIDDKNIGITGIKYSKTEKAWIVQYNNYI